MNIASILAAVTFGAVASPPALEPTTIVIGLDG